MSCSNVPHILDVLDAGSCMTFMPNKVVTDRSRLLRNVFQAPDTVGSHNTMMAPTENFGPNMTSSNHGRQSQHAKD